MRTDFAFRLRVAPHQRWELHHDDRELLLRFPVLHLRVRRRALLWEVLLLMSMVAVALAEAGERIRRI